MEMPQIPLVIDLENPVRGAITANLVNEYFELHEIEAIRNSKRARFACYRCNDPAVLHSRSIDGGHKYHFQHLAGHGLRCDWKTGKTSKAQIYKGIKEGCKHRELKKLLADTLFSLPGWQIDPDKVDTYFLFSPDARKKGKPDVHAFQGEEEYVFEIQLRSESPETLSRRKEFYAESDRKLLWVSAENTEIVSEQFALSCKEIKQVQLDIAFSNRGNWLIFNEYLAQRSLEEEELVLQVMYWCPEQHGKSISYSWKTEEILFSELNFVDGETFYFDFHEADALLKAELKVQGQKDALASLSKEKVRNYEEFLGIVKNAWPSLDQDSDSAWLNAVYEQDRNRRVLSLKRSILNVFIRHNEDCYGPDYKKWKAIASRTYDLGFGIHADMDLRVVEKILLILGIKLSEFLCPDRGSHYQSLHYFFDYSSFFPYRDIAINAVKLSAYRKEILNHPSILKRLATASAAMEQNDDIDKFLEWFTSSPELEL